MSTNNMPPRVQILNEIQKEDFPSQPLLLIQTPMDNRGSRQFCEITEMLGIVPKIVIS